MENTERPKYIIKVSKSWEYGPARFWDIQTWVDKGKNDGYWRSISGGIAYTKVGMRWAINRRLKKMKLGNSTGYFNLDGSVFEGIK